MENSNNCAVFDDIDYLKLSENELTTLYNNVPAGLRVWVIDRLLSERDIVDPFNGTRKTVEYFAKKGYIQRREERGSIFFEVDGYDSVQKLKEERGNLYSKHKDEIDKYPKPEVFDIPKSIKDRIFQSLDRE